MASVAVANTTGTAAAQSMSNAMHVDGPSTADPMPAAGITRTRTNVKGKHLMRSQALRESASPPRAPIDTGPPVVVIAHDEPPTGGASPTNASGSSASTAAPPPPFFTSPKSSSLSSSSPPTIHSASPTNVAGCDLTTPAFLDQEFPKLAQPKSKGTRGGHNGTSPPFKTSPVNGAAEIKKPHLLEVTPITSGPNKVPLLPRSCSSDKDYGHCCTTAGTDCSSSDNCAGCSAEEMPTRMTGERSKKNRNMAGGGAGGGGGGGGGLFVKGSKPRLKSLGSSASADEVISSGFISRDDSFEQYTDSNGVDLLQFFKETLNKNTKDRNTLIRIEKDLMALALDRSRSTVKFPPMSSYNRMLIHRVSAYFGMEHNVDATQQCVIAGITKATRVPEVRFRSLIRDDEPRKSILKRESQSFDEYRRGMLRGGGGPGDYRGGLLDRKAKSFEEREEEYERVKLRIFKKREAAAVAAAAESAENGGAIAVGGGGDQYWPSWGGSDSSEHDGMQAMRGGHKSSKGNRLLKVQSLSVETKPEGRPPISKSHSFGGYGPASAVHKSHPHGSRLFSKQDSLTTSWRLSPSSSGYKTQTQSIRSDSVTPSPTGYESGGDQTPEPSHTGEQPTACGVVWAVTDMAAVPPGSVLIDPQTLQPIINQDGSIYHFDPDNLPVPCHARKSHNKQPIVDEADETAAAGCGDECIDGDDDLTCRDSQCIEDAPPPLLGNYPAELYEPLPVDMHSQQQQQQQICHQSVVDAANNIQNFDLSCELTTIEHETGELSITNKAEMHVENLSIIPEDGQPLAENESPLEYVNAAEGTLMQYPPPPYQSEANIPKAAGGVQYFTYPSTDVELGPGTYLVPVYDPPADVAALSGHHPHQQHSSPQTNQPHGQTGVGGTTAVYTSPSANMAPAILPLAYPPTMFHGAATAHHPHHMAPTASAQLVYAAAPLDATGAPMAGGQSAPQYFTIPMGYPYASNDPAYASYWPNPMTYYVPQAVATPNTDSATSATFHPNSSYPMHPHLVSTTATTAYTTAYTAKRGSPTAQQAQQQHQQQQSHHHQHHHAAIAASAVHQHHSPYATATTFNASLSFAPNQTGVVPYVTAAAAAATAAAASGDAGALMKGLYPIPQPIYTNFVHQAYQQQQQQQHHHQSHHQPHQHQQQQQQQQLLPRPTVPGPSASSVQTTVATTTTATSSAVLPSPPSLSNSCSPPQTALSSSANSSPTLSSPSPPTSTNTVTTVLSPTSAAAASFQPINPPYELTATYGKPPASARYHQHHLHNNHHHHQSVDRASSSYGSESYSPPTATTGSGLYRKPHSFYNNGYAQHSGSSAGIMYTPGGSGRPRPQPSTGAEHYATAAYVSQAHHHHSQQPSHHHHSQQPSHHHQHHHHGSSTGAPHHNGSNGAAVAAGTSSFTYHKNQFKFHMQKRSATIDNMSAPITPTTSQPSAHYFQAGGTTSGGGGTTGGSNTSFRTHPSHGAGAAGGHHHLQLAPLMAFHGGSSAEHKYRPTGPRGPKSTYLGNKYVPPGGQQTTATVATVTHAAAQQPSTSRSSPHSSVHSTESANGGSAGATGGGSSSVLSLPLCDSPPQHSAAAAVAGQAATAVAQASSRMYVGTMAGEAGLTSTVSSGPLVPTCYGSTTSSSSSAAVAAAAAMAAGYAAGPSTGMYVKLGQAFFAHHPSLSFANHHHHRTKIYTAKDVRPQIGHHLSEILPSMNMMLTTPRLMNPRSSNHNMTGRTPRPR